jgi:hypothetical protein
LNPQGFSRQLLLLLRRKLERNPGFLGQRRTPEKKQKSETKSYSLHRGPFGKASTTEAS